MPNPGQPPPPPTGNVPPATQPQGQQLPQTGIQQQLNSLNSYYSSVQSAPGVGFDPRQQQFGQGQTPLPQQRTGMMGSTSLDRLARSLAESYGLAIGRGRLVDDQGNFLMTPDQLAGASGGSETLGTAAAKMNYISAAIAKAQTEKSQKKAEAAMQTGIGLVQSRARGSLATLQSGYYANLASMYESRDYEAADFSYFIQKEKMDIEQEQLRRAEKLAKKQARGKFFGGLAMGIAGFATGNVALGAGGLAQAGGAAGSTGWF